ncbi:hypothetical protein BC830DRAFT_637272 [Chytriomyces sp. MP71]|nr:hypothetical protein BC830DRAFT_637272 [Chytriomyces sp. MP71]
MEGTSDQSTQILALLHSINERLAILDERQARLETALNATQRTVQYVANALVNKNRRFYTNLDKLPHEVVARVLLFIAPFGAQSLLRLRRVSRAFAAILADPHFATQSVTLHLALNPAWAPTKRLSSQDPLPLSPTTTAAIATQQSITPGSAETSTVLLVSKQASELDKAWFSWPANFQEAYVAVRLSKLSEIDWKNTSFSTSPQHTFFGAAAIQIPRAFALLTPSLVHLTLYRCKLLGSIPAELGELVHLVTLRLDDNHLTGSIPPQLSRLTRLLYLCLDQNKLSGSIPAELCALRELKLMNLRRNCFTGSVPVELGVLEKLTTLYLSCESLDLTIPDGITVGGVVWSLMRREGFR